MSTPEYLLLLASARTAPDAARIHALADAGVDWSALLDLARRHKVRPLVYKALRETCWERIPADVQAEWERTNWLLTGGNLLLAGELLRVTAALESAGVRAAAMKGAAIAAMVYGDIALREYEDIDLLVTEADFPRAVELLEGLGYQPFWKRDSRTVLDFLRNVGEYTLTNSERRTTIDLHWRVSTAATALAPDVSDFPSGFQPFTFGGETLLSFAPVDLPLYLASQGGWDRWDDLKRICDLAEFLRRFPDVDLGPSLNAARRLRGERSMLIGFWLVSNLLGAKLPDVVTKRLRADAVAVEMAERAAQELEQGPDAGDAVGRYLFQMKARAGLRGKMSLASSIAVDRTAHDGNWIMLPRPLWWMYGFLRPLRLGAKMLRHERENS
jgi:hypothetical protein